MYVCSSKTFDPLDRVLPSFAWILFSSRENIDGGGAIFLTNLCRFKKKVLYLFFTPIAVQPGQHSRVLQLVILLQCIF